MDDWTPPTPPGDGWSLDEFVTVVSDALGALGSAALPPDRRTVRYYATLGLVDKPRAAGREARYATHHLLQVLAVKQLQQQGTRLGDVASVLDGRDDDALTRLATGVDATAAPEPAPVRPWQMQPHLTRPRLPHTPPPVAPSAWHQQTVVTLAPGVQLTLPEHTLTSTERAAVERAAAALVATLTAMGVVPSPNPKDL